MTINDAERQFIRRGVDVKAHLPNNSTVRGTVSGVCSATDTATVIEFETKVKITVPFHRMELITYGEGNQ